MYATVLIYIIILLAILGLSFLIESSWLLCLKPKNAPPRDVIIYLKNDIAHSQIRYIIEEQKWHGKYKINNIFAVANDITDEELSYYKSMFKNIVFIKNIGDEFGDN